ncbi:MAG: transposase [Inquilinus sp.]|nr:transposase [Inquilinus sp.]
MGKSYSLDLRERVYGSIAGGQSRRAAARHFKVSPSFAVQLAARVETTGSARPARQGRPPGGGKLAPYVDFLMSRVEAMPDITMPELAAALEAEHGVSVHPSSLSRFLRRRGLTYKKIAVGPRERSRRRQA